jgi:hypothetical protein
MAETQDENLRISTTLLPKTVASCPRVQEYEQCVTDADNALYQCTSNAGNGASLHNNQFFATDDAAYDCICMMYATSFNKCAPMCREVLVEFGQQAMLIHKQCPTINVSGLSAAQTMPGPDDDMDELSEVFDDGTVRALETKAGTYQPQVLSSNGNRVLAGIVVGAAVTLFL